MNCGVCEKCTRTQVNLRIAGAIERCSAFAVPLNLEAVARLDLGNENVRAFAEENLTAAQAKGDDPELIAALEACLGIASRPSRASQRVPTFWEKVRQTRIFKRSPLWKR